MIPLNVVLFNTLLHINANLLLFLVIDGPVLVNAKKMTL